MIRMPAPEELTFKQLRERVRRWVIYFYERTAEGGGDRKDYAEGLGFKPATISNLLNENELPGLLCFYRLHFRLGADPLRMLREEPPALQTAAPKAKKRAT